MEFFANDLETALGELMRVDEIWINELVTYQNFYGTLERILRLKREQGAKLLMLLHDFFALCPAVNLIDAEGKYCGVPSCESVINVFRITAAMPAQNTEPELSGVQNSGNFCQTVMRSVHFPMIRQGCSSVLIRMYTISM